MFPVQELENCGDLFTPRRPLCPVENLEDEMRMPPLEDVGLNEEPVQPERPMSPMPDYFLLKNYYTADSSIDSYDLESDETQDWGEEGDVEDELEVNQDPGVQDEEERSLPERSRKRCREKDEEEEEKRSTKGLRHDLEYFLCYTQNPPAVCTEVVVDNEVFQEQSKEVGHARAAFLEDSKGL